MTPARSGSVALRSALVAIVIAVGVAGPARADSTDDARGAARELAQKGDAEFSAGRCSRAIALWKKADAKFHAPTIVLRVARCQALTGKVVEATTTLESIIADKLGDDAPPAFVDAKTQAATELPGVRARIATLGVAVWARGTPVEPLLEINHVAAPKGKRSFSVDPGIHQVRIRAAESAWEGTITLEEGEARALRVTLRAEQTPTPTRAQRIAGFVVGGFGIAALGVGAGFAYSAASTASTLDDACGPTRTLCPAAEQDRIDRIQGHALAADLFLGGGAALVLGGAVLLLTESTPKKEPPRVRLAPVASGGLGAVLSGSY